MESLNYVLIILSFITVSVITIMSFIELTEDERYFSNATDCAHKNYEYELDQFLKNPEKYKNEARRIILVKKRLAALENSEALTVNEKHFPKINLACFMK